MKKNVKIKLLSKQFDGDEKNIIELISEGTYMHKGSKSIIAYEETEATGMEGTRTTIYVHNDRLLTLVREGAVYSKMIIEAGKKHHCQYQTPYGMLNVGVSAMNIVSSLGDNGGKLDFSYVIDVDSSYVGDFRISLDVKPVN